MPAAAMEVTPEERLESLGISSRGGAIGGGAVAELAVGVVAPGIGGAVLNGQAPVPAASDGGDSGRECGNEVWRGVPSGSAVAELAVGVVAPGVDRPIFEGQAEGTASGDGCDSGGGSVETPTGSEEEAVEPIPSWPQVFRPAA